MQYFGGFYLGGNFYGGDHSARPVIIGGDISVIVISSDYIIDSHLSTIAISYDVDIDQVIQPEYVVTSEMTLVSLESNVIQYQPVLNSELSISEYKASLITSSLKSPTQSKPTSELNVKNTAMKTSLEIEITTPSIHSVKAEFGVTKQVATGSMQSQVLDLAKPNFEYSVEEI